MKEARNFWLYAMGALISLIGSGIQDIALSLFIFDFTGSGTVMGTFMIIATAPRLILYPLAGVVGDRFNRKWIMVSMDFGRGVVILLLALLAARNLISIPLLFSAQFVVSIMNALFGPATSAMLPDIVKEEDLTRGNSIMGSISSFSFVVGPALGGVIYGIGGITAAFLFNSISFAGSAVSELFIKYEQETRKLEKVQEVFTDLKDGINFVRTHRGLLALLMLALVINFLINPTFKILVPYVMRVVIKFSSHQFGLLQASLIMGTLIGNIIISTVLAKANVEKMLTRGLLGLSGFMLVFSFLMFPRIIEIFGFASWTLFSAMVLTLILMGMSTAFINTPVLVEIQKLAPTEFRARVFSVIDVIAQGIIPIGYGIVGVLLDTVPAHLIAFVLLIFVFLAVLLFIFRYAKEVFR